MWSWGEFYVLVLRSKRAGAVLWLVELQHCSAAAFAVEAFV
jgi:hypothetical protein